MRILLSLILSLRAGSEPILFRGPDASELEYRARLRAEEAFRTPTQAYLAQHPTPRAREALLARFTRAQQAFLTNSIGEARRHFQEVVALLPTDDWDSADREVFLNAFLRLAQLERGASDRDHWLAQIPFLGPGLKIQDDLFPPPVLERLRAIERRRPRLEVDPARLDWPLVLINGVPCRPHACPSFPAPENSVRLTFVSDQWATQTTHADLGELARLRPARVAWVTGACGTGGLTAAARELGAGRPFFDLRCEGGRPAAAPTFAPALAAPVDDPKSVPPAALTPIAPRPRPFYKSPWLWATLGAIAITAVVIAVQTSRRSTSSETTSAPAPGGPRRSPRPAPTPTPEPAPPITRYP